MRLLFSFSLLLSSFTGLSYELMPYRAPYEVVSDDFDSTIPVGTCVVFGTSVIQSGSPIQNGTVATLDRSASCITDVKGNYSMTFSANDSAIFFYHPYHGEIVIWSYDFKSQHRLNINFYAPPRYHENQTVKKPVIYLYSDVEMNAELTLTHPNITFTYPQYNENWSVKTLANGFIQDVTSQKIYPYLFWEGETKDLRYQSQNEKIAGQLIRTDSLVKFLEASLTQMGLNQTEQTDFITFWAPQICTNEFIFIQFLIDEDYDELVAGLTVSPSPDSRRRIFMQFTLLENDFVPFEYSSQEFPEFTRTGFTLIEWGGSEIDFLTEIN